MEPATAFQSRRANAAMSFGCISLTLSYGAADGDPPPPMAFNALRCCTTCPVAPIEPNPDTALRDAAAIDVRIAPSGRPHLVPAHDGAADGLSPATRRRIVDAFECSAGNGVLVLGGAAPAAPLAPPLAFLRDVGKLFVTRLCASPDLETLRGDVVLSPPTQELARLADTPPPMPGAEYVDAALLDR